MGIVIETLKQKGSKSGIRRYSDDIITYVQVIKVYREDFGALDGIEFVDNAGVYVLCGIDEFGRTVVYTGESENVYRRVVEEHTKSASKDFFNEVFLITTIDNSLNKAEVICLEDLIYNRFKLSPDVKITNVRGTGTGNVNTRSLNKMKAITEVIVEILSSATNCNFLEMRYDETPETLETEFSLRGIKGCGVKATYINGELIVKKGSLLSINVATSCPAYVKNTRDELLLKGSISFYKDDLIVTEDIPFVNITRCSNIMTGSSVSNASSKWLNASGTTLEEYMNK